MAYRQGCTVRQNVERETGGITNKKKKNQDTFTILDNLQ
jgi:hypothetical protein